MSDRQTYVPIGEIFADTDGCRICGRPVTAPFNLYCSRYCKNVAEAVHSLFTWETVRSWVRDVRDDRTCVRCGRESPELPRGVHLQVDHITPVSRGGHPFDPRNLQTLCEPCHHEKGMKERDYRDEDYVEAPARDVVQETTLAEFTDHEPDGPSLLELGRDGGGENA